MKLIIKTSLQLVAILIDKRLSEKVAFVIFSSFAPTLPRAKTQPLFFCYIV
jgi:hypothetical protein